MVGRGVDPRIDVLLNPGVETGPRKDNHLSPLFPNLDSYVSVGIKISQNTVCSVKCSFQLPDSLTELLNISTSSRSVGLALWKVVPNNSKANRLDALQNPVKSNKMSCFALYAIVRCSHLFEIRVNLKIVTLT